MKLENTFKDWFSSLLGSVAMIYAGYGWHMEWITSKEAGIVAFIGFVLLFLRTRLTQVISDGLGKVFEAVMRKIFGNNGGQPPAPTTIILLMILFSFNVDAQVINVKEARFINKTDSVGISGIGMQRWDNATGKFRFWNGSSWLSYETVSNAATKFWKTSGTTNITTPIIVGSPTIQGTIIGTGNLTLGSSGTSGSISLNRPTGGATIGTITQTDTYTDFNNAQGSGYRMLVAGDPRLIITAATGVDWTLGAAGLQGNTGGISLSGVAPVANTLTFGPAGNIEAVSGNAPINYRSGVVTATTGTVNGHSFALGSGFNLSSGTTTFNQMVVSPQYNTTGTYSGIARGIYYSPVLTSTVGLTNIAFESTSGNIIFGGGSSVLAQPNAVTVDGGLNSSPIFKLRGRYDSDETTAIVSSDYNLDLVHTMTSGGASPASRLSVNNHEGTELLNITSTGNVGIGTPVPVSKLSLGSVAPPVNSLGQKIAIYEDGAGNAYRGIAMYNNSSSYGVGIWAIGTATAPTGSNVSLFVQDGGNIGISTATPNAPLQFAQTTVNRKIVLFEDANNDHQYYGFGVNSTGATRYQSAGITSTHGHVFYGGASTIASNELFRIKGNGIVNIPTAPAIDNTQTQILVRNSTSGDIQYRDVTTVGGTSGTYTPTFTAVNNLDAVPTATANTAKYSRAGNIVTVTFYANVDPTATGLYEFSATLPVASALTAATQLLGLGSSASNYGLEAIADITNDRAKIVGNATIATLHSVYITLTYEVL